jgi:hypothetical protein
MAGLSIAVGKGQGIGIKDGERKSSIKKKNKLLKENTSTFPRGGD